MIFMGRNGYTDQATSTGALRNSPSFVSCLVVDWWSGSTVSIASFCRTRIRSKYCSLKISFFVEWMQLDTYSARPGGRNVTAKTFNAKLVTEVK